jgi:RNA polymerase sigma factor (sigma-70 family)
MKNEPDDRDLLRRYVEKRDEAAFGELVRRHVNLVYGGALRRVGGDRHLAHDVTQQVFCDLAKRAAKVAEHEVLAGWLHTSTRFAAANVVRSEQRRRAREQAAFTMNATEGEAEPQVAWDTLRPVLDETIDDLDERDRAAVVLRFFEGASFAAIGARLQLNENAARMRVDRALDKLQRLLAQRGIRSTAAALAAAMTSQAAAMAPAGLASTITQAALAAGVAGGTGAAVVASNGFMSMATLQVGVSGALAVAGAVGFVSQNRTAKLLEEEAAAVRTQNSVVRTLEVETVQLRRLALEAAELRRDDAEFDRLQSEATALRGRLQQVARAEERAASGSGAFDIRSLDQTPRPKFQARPNYPAEMRTAGVTGEVVVDFVIDPNGDVKEAKALRSSRAEFEPYAVEAVSKWKFVPGKKGGQDVPTRMQVPIVFTLAGQKANHTSPAKAPTANTAPAVQGAPFNVESK